MNIKYLVVTLFSLGLVTVSCGKKKKEDHKEPTEQQAETPGEHGDHGHDHGEHGHDH